MIALRQSEWHVLTLRLSILSVIKFRVILLEGVGNKGTIIHGKVARVFKQGNKLIQTGRIKIWSRTKKLCPSIKARRTFLICSYESASRKKLVLSSSSVVLTWNAQALKQIRKWLRYERRMKLTEQAYTLKWWRWCGRYSFVILIYLPGEANAAFTKWKLLTTSFFIATVSKRLKLEKEILFKSAYGSLLDMLTLGSEKRSDIVHNSYSSLISFGSVSAELSLLFSNYESHTKWVNHAERITR